MSLAKLVMEKFLLRLAGKMMIDFLEVLVKGDVGLDGNSLCLDIYLLVSLLHRFFYLYKTFLIFLHLYDHYGSLL